MTAVFACSDAAYPGEAPPGTAHGVIELAGLCDDPNQVARFVPEGEDLLVFMIHRRDVNLGALQSAARRLGFDPLGVGVIDLDSLPDSHGAELALEGVIARISEFPGAAPDQVKLLPADRSTRRGFLGLGTPMYVGAPMIHPADCAAADGCKACVAQCPVGALEWSGGAVAHDITACIACGICVTACPTGAIANPVVAPEAVEAELLAVIGLSGPPIGIRYRCRDSYVDGERGWHQVEVPCTGMLTVGWMLAPLLMGASRVDAVSCDSGGCGLGNDERLRATVRDFDLARAALGERITASGARGLLGPDATRRGLGLVADSDAAISLDFESADVGNVTIEPSVCTACEMCAQICPTAAIESVVDRAGVHIYFDPKACVGCGQCVGTCPEAASGAIFMSKTFDGAEWAVGRRELRHDPTPACEICGGPVAPAAMLSRIGELLGEDGGSTMSMIARRCINHRGR